MSKVSIVVPAYNEQERILQTLRCMLFVPADEVVVVCDGRDDTAKLARDLRDKWKVENPEKKIVVYEAFYRLGKGGAFKEGVKRSHGEQVFLVDADFPVPFWSVGQFSKLLESYDCVVGSRYSETSAYFGEPFGRMILSKGYRELANWMFQTDFKDFQCGFKAFRREPLLKVLDDMIIEGFAFDVDLLLRLKKAGYSVYEEPVEYRFSKHGKVGWRQVFGMFWELLQIRHEFSSDPFLNR